MKPMSITIQPGTITTLRRWLAPAALGMLLGAMTPACGGGGGGGEGQGDASGSSTGSGECEPGTSYECTCEDGSAGTQVCSPDGRGRQPCACGGDDAGPTTSASADGSASGTAGTSDTPSSSGPEPGTDATAADPSTSGDASTTAATSGETGPTSSSPTVQINNPGDGDMRPAGVVIPFVGEASDAQDGMLAGASLVWVDDIEGELGQGETFDAMLFTLGEHVITLTATDADGNVGEDSITLTIFEQ